MATITKIRSSKQIYIDADFDVNSKKLTNVSAPTLDTDATTKGYVDSAINSKLMGLDWQNSVLTKGILTPPVSPTVGDRYLIYGTGLGSWTGHNNQIAEWNGTVWQYATPNNGFTLLIEDESAQYNYNGSSWNKIQTGIQPHDLVSSSHTVSGLTTGYFLKATGVNTFGFSAHGLTYTDVGAQPAHTVGNLTETSSSVLNISGGSGILYGGNAQIQVKKSSTTQDGYLSSADFTSFSNKLSVNNYVNREDLSGVKNGSNCVFTLANTPISGTEMIFYSGILLESGPGLDYTISGNTITLASELAPLSSTKLKATYWK